MLISFGSSAYKTRLGQMNVDQILTAEQVEMIVAKLEEERVPLARVQSVLLGGLDPTFIRVYLRPQAPTVVTCSEVVEL